MINSKTKCLLSVSILLILLVPVYLQAQAVNYINSDSVRKVRGYSHAVLFPNSGTVKTSGIIGTRQSGELVTTSPREQIRQTFINLKNILEASGATIDQIDEIETFLTDSIYFRDYVLERVDFFKGRKVPPISKTYYTKGLINSKAIVEINVSASIATMKQKDENIFYVTAIIEAKEGKAEKLQELLTANILPSRNEKGCIQYDLFRGGKDSEQSTFILHEQWTSKEAFDLHFQMPYMKELSSKIKDLIKTSSINAMEKID